MDTWCTTPWSREPHLYDVLHRTLIGSIANGNNPPPAGLVTCENGPANLDQKLMLKLLSSRLAASVVVCCSLFVATSLLSFFVLEVMSRVFCTTFTFCL